MKILFATDGSESARVAIDMLSGFPFPGDRSAVVLTVVDGNVFVGDTHSYFDEDQRRLLRETEQTLVEEGGQLLDDAAARLQAAGWSCSTRLLRGNPAEEIIRAAEELRPDLVVLGSHGLKGVRHFLLGSVSDRVLEYACCSVLIVKPSPVLAAATEAGGETPPWRILVAYDGSAPAIRALGFCASLPLEDSAEVSVVGVMPMVHMYRQDIRQQLNPIWQQHKHARQKSLEKAVAGLQWSTPRVTAELLESTSVSRQIIDLATDRAIDLVIIGSKGRSAFKRFLLGSSTNRVAGHAPCSVLVVREAAEPD